MATELAGLGMPPVAVVLGVPPVAMELAGMGVPPVVVVVAGVDWPPVTETLLAVVEPPPAVVPAPPGSPSVDDCVPPAPPCGPSELAPEQAISPKSVNNGNSEKRRRVGMIFLNG